MKDKIYSFLLTVWWIIVTAIFTLFATVFSRRRSVLGERKTYLDSIGLSRNSGRNQKERIKH